MPNDAQRQKKNEIAVGIVVVNGVSTNEFHQGESTSF
jgi:hypothetical protein